MLETKFPELKEHEFVIPYHNLYVGNLSVFTQLTSFWKDSKELH